MAYRETITLRGKTYVDLPSSDPEVAIAIRYDNYMVGAIGEDDPLADETAHAHLHCMLGARPVRMVSSGRMSRDDLLALLCGWAWN